ncbi:MAG: hypothetical protein ACU84J_12760 [Gammaproteobacteria bacterium]
MDEQVKLEFERHRQLGSDICMEMLKAIQKMGFPEEQIQGLVPNFEQAQFSLVKDPYTTHENLTGSWFDGNRQRVGNIQFLSDGSFYAEYDIVKPHPVKKQWFVEGISAWGREGMIKTEAKLLPAVE